MPSSSLLILGFLANIERFSVYNSDGENLPEGFRHSRRLSDLQLPQFTEAVRGPIGELDDLDQCQFARLVLRKILQPDGGVADAPSLAVLPRATAGVPDFLTPHLLVPLCYAAPGADDRANIWRSPKTSIKNVAIKTDIISEVAKFVQEVCDGACAHPGARMQYFEKLLEAYSVFDMSTNNPMMPDNSDARSDTLEPGMTSNNLMQTLQPVAELPGAPRSRAPPRSKHERLLGQLAKLRSWTMRIARLYLEQDPKERRVSGLSISLVGSTTPRTSTITRTLTQGSVLLGLSENQSNAKQAYFDLLERLHRALLLLEDEAVGHFVVTKVVRLVVMDVVRMTMELVHLRATAFVEML